MLVLQLKASIFFTFTTKVVFLDETEIYEGNLTKQCHKVTAVNLHKAK